MVIRSEGKPNLANKHKLKIFKQRQRIEFKRMINSKKKNVLKKLRGKSIIGIIRKSWIYGFNENILRFKNLNLGNC